MIGSIFKIVFAALVAVSVLACALVFEASSAASIATGLAQDAKDSASESVQLTLLERGVRALDGSWAQPLRWHAGATEAMSAIKFMQGELQSDPAELGQSATWAVQTTRLAPVSPNAWLRLAALSNRGIANSVCDIGSCLAHSFAIARMLDGDDACIRLRLVHNVETPAEEGARLDDYLRSGVSRRGAAKCLGTFIPPLSPDQVFTLAMRASPGR